MWLEYVVLRMNAFEVLSNFQTLFLETTFFICTSKYLKSDFYIHYYRQHFYWFDKNQSLWCEILLWNIFIHVRRTIEKSLNYYQKQEDFLSLMFRVTIMWFSFFRLANSLEVINHFLIIIRSLQYTIVQQHFKLLYYQ